MYITQVKLHSEYYPTDRYYPFNIPTLRRTTALALRKPVVFFVGEKATSGINKSAARATTTLSPTGWWISST